MSAKHLRRKDLKHDEFITSAGRATHWLMERRRRIGWALLAIALVVSVVASVRFAHQRQEQQAAALLAVAMEVYRAPVVPPAPELPAATVELPPLAAADATDGPSDEGAVAAETAAETSAETAGDASSATTEETAGATAGETPGQTSAEPATAEPAPVPAPVITGLQFATAEEKHRAALERFEPIIERYGERPSGRVAAYYAGICHSELGDSAAAMVALTQASEASGPLISSMALYRLGQLEFGIGNAEAAVGYFERLVEKEDGLFPREEALMAKARAHREAGDPRAALATYQLVLQDFPASSSESEARGHVEEISAQLGVDPDIQG